jgi:hypothetical protein
MTTVADNKSQNVIPASARTGQRNKIMPSKAFYNNNIWNTQSCQTFKNSTDTVTQSSNKAFQQLQEEGSFIFHMPFKAKTKIM